MIGRSTLGDFLKDVARAAGLPATAKTVGFLSAMAQKEGGHFHNSCSYNPLNTSKKIRGSRACTGSIQAYPGFSEGVRATADTLRLSYYSGVRAALSRGDIDGAATALQKSGWCGGPSAPCPGYGQAVRSLYPALSYSQQAMARSGSGSSGSGGARRSGARRRPPKNHPSGGLPRSTPVTSAPSVFGCKGLPAELNQSRLDRVAVIGQIQREKITASDLEGFRQGKGWGAVGDGLAVWQEDVANLYRSIAGSLVADCGATSLEEAYRKASPEVVKAFNTGNATDAPFSGLGGVLENLSAYLKVAAGGLVIAAGGIVILVAVGIVSKGSAAGRLLPASGNRGAAGGVTGSGRGGEAKSSPPISEEKIPRVSRREARALAGDGWKAAKRGEPVGGGSGKVDLGTRSIEGTPYRKPKEPARLPVGGFR